MPLSDEILAWAALTRTPALGARALEALLRRFGSAAAFLAAADGQRERAGLPAEAREHLRRPPHAAAAEIEWLEGPRHHLLPLTDARYPKLLNALRDKPVALYVSGELGALGDPQLAIVGSRNPTCQGSETAFEFAHYLAERGIAITSGFAAGIDAAAHRGALAARGATVAVLGSGVDTIYPRCNRLLGETVAERGVLVSEFPLGTLPRRSNFPRRNRIIAALSLGTLVVEAAHGSGSLITARIARHLGRTVFALPGSIRNPLSRGCHALIKKGAKLAESADDIMSELRLPALFPAEPRGCEGESPRTADRTGMDKQHKILLDALGFDPADLDMLILELEGHVQAAPGGRYSRVSNRRAGGERQRSGSAHLSFRELHERRR
jgi:DNA processing protein